MEDGAGLDIQLDEGLRLEGLHPGVELLAPEDFDHNPLVIRLAHGQASLLLTGDIQAAVEGELLVDDVHPASAVMCHLHHGARRPRYRSKPIHNQART